MNRARHRGLLLLLALGGLGGAVSAAEFPSRPVRLIIPYALGGATDITARQLARGDQKVGQGRAGQQHRRRVAVCRNWIAHEVSCITREFDVALRRATHC